MPSVETDLAMLRFPSPPLSRLRRSQGRSQCGLETVPRLERNAEALLCHSGHQDRKELGCLELSDHGEESQAFAVGQTSANKIRTMWAGETAQ